ncbi:hypothetical protein HanRHA438_Chr05g0229361 [Helianthus annuus]|nr:hypothetical protein HanRHA438_Chr05g0229361 [Helianthus annuus]
MGCYMLDGPQGGFLCLGHTHHKLACLDFYSFNSHTLGYGLAIRGHITVGLLTCCWATNG